MSDEPGKLPALDEPSTRPTAVQGKAPNHEHEKRTEQPKENGFTAWLRRNESPAKSLAAMLTAIGIAIALVRWVAAQASSDLEVLYRSSAVQLPSRLEEVSDAIVTKLQVAAFERRLLGGKRVDATCTSTAMAKPIVEAVLETRLTLLELTMHNVSDRRLEGLRLKSPVIHGLADVKVTSTFMSDRETADAQGSLRTDAGTHRRASVVWSSVPTLPPDGRLTVKFWGEDIGRETDTSVIAAGVSWRLIPVEEVEIRGLVSAAKSFDFWIWPLGSVFFSACGVAVVLINAAKRIKAR